MYLVATIVKSRENVVFPFEWITGMHLDENIRDGINQSDTYLAFHSPNENKQANFGIWINEKFDENIDACYIVSPIIFTGMLPNRLN